METAGNRVWSPAWEHGWVSMGVYRTKLPGTDPLQGSSPSHPRHQVESIQSVGSVGSVGSIASIHPKNSNIPYWYCPLCTPSLTLPPSSLKCLQKSNPNIHIKCFRCFKCFGCFRCFMFAFGPQNRPILVQIRTNPANRPNRPTAISWLRKTPKIAIHPLVYEHDTALFVIAAVLFLRSGFFFGRRGGKPRRQTEVANPLSEMAYCGGCGKGVGFAEILSHPVDAGGRIVCNKALGSVK